MKPHRLSILLLSAWAVAPAFAEEGTAAKGGDAEVIAVLAAVNDHEIKSAGMARDKGVTGEVAAYARMMVDEHTANLQQTRQLAETAGVTPAETDKVKALKSKTADERGRLDDLDGAAFEAAYIDAMVKDHAEVLARIDKELLPNASDPAVTDHLRKTREHVAHHLEEARRLDAQSTAAIDAD